MMNTLSLNLLLSPVLLFFSLSAVAQEDLKNKALNYTQSLQQEVRDNQAQRKLWSLSKDDWLRYKTLMKGIRGSISPQTISPIEVLGTHARNESERRKYAEIWAKMRHDDITRIIAFQKAYNAAFDRLYPNEKMIDLSLLKQQPKVVLGAGDRLLVFLTLASCAECESIINRIMQDIAFNKIHIDIYFVDTNPLTDDNKIRDWATQHNISQKRLKSGRITLNHDKGSLYKITQNIGSPVPIVFRLNNKGLSQFKDY